MKTHTPTDCIPGIAGRRATTLIMAVVVTGSLVLSAPWRVVDRDVLARLAVGRFVVHAGPVQRSDPFTFSRPELRWSDPEWVGDLIWYGTYRLAGDHGIVILALALAVCGWMLTLLVARRGGAGALVVGALLLIAVPGAADRLQPRNALHAQWLIPLAMLLLQQPYRRRARLWLFVPLAIAWANMHSSFVVGWVLVGAALLDHLFCRQRDRKTIGILVALLAMQPLLAMVSPHGPHVYAQLLDHLRGAPIYRSVILEWRPPGEVSSGLRLLPLHLLGILGLLSFLPRPNRRPGPLTRVLLGLAMAYGSQRFMELLAVLTVPDIAANLQRWLDARTDRGARWPRAVSVVLLATGVGMVAFHLRNAFAAPAPGVLHRSDAPVAVGHFLSAEASADTRLFNPYNAGPALLWLTGPRVKLYIDPRNNLGAPWLASYLELLTGDPDAFERDATQRNIDLALVDLSDGRFSKLAWHLRQTHAWQPVFIDGRYSVYARETPRTIELRQRWGYTTLRGGLAFDELAHADKSAVEVDLRRLEHQGPALSRALRGYLLLAEQGPPPPRLGPPRHDSQTAEARDLLAKALPELPPSPALMGYLACAHARLGNHAAADDVLRVARALFPGDESLAQIDRELEQQHPH